MSLTDRVSFGGENSQLLRRFVHQGEGKVVFHWVAANGLILFLLGIDVNGSPGVVQVSGWWMVDGGHAG